MFLALKRQVCPPVLPGIVSDAGLESPVGGPVYRTAGIPSILSFVFRRRGLDSQINSSWCFAPPKDKKTVWAGTTINRPLLRGLSPPFPSRLTQLRGCGHSKDVGNDKG